MERGEPLARASRYVQRALPFPDGDEAKQRDYLLELADRHGLDNWVLFPTRDDTAALLGRHGDQLVERFRLTAPRWDVMRWAYDKRLTDRFAQNARVDYPWTSYPRDGSDVAAIDCSFPVILKPAVKAELNRFTHDKAWQADDRATLLARYEEACTLVDPDLIMVQELIPGGGDAHSPSPLCAQMAVRSHRSLLGARVSIRSTSGTRARLSRRSRSRASRSWRAGCWLSSPTPASSRSSSSTTRVPACTNSSTSIPASGPGTRSAAGQESISPISRGGLPSEMWCRASAAGRAFGGFASRRIFPQASARSAAAGFRCGATPGRSSARWSRRCLPGTTRYRHSGTRRFAGMPSASASFE